MNTEQFFNELSGHDWYYTFSDDHGVYSKGYQDRLRLEKIAAEEDETLRRMLKDFVSYKYSGKPWDTPQEPKPELSNYL